MVRKTKVEPKVEEKPTTKAEAKPVKALPQLGSSEAELDTLRAMIWTHWSEVKALSNSKATVLLNKLMGKAHHVCVSVGQVYHAVKKVQKTHHTRVKKTKATIAAKKANGNGRLIRIHKPAAVVSREMRIDALEGDVAKLKTVTVEERRNIYRKIADALVESYVADLYAEGFVELFGPDAGLFYTRQEQTEALEEQVPAEATA